MDKIITDAPCWYAIYTKPRDEYRAENNLSTMVETFFPKVKQRLRNQSAGNAGYQIKPFFPRYIFARFNASSLFHKVSFTRGVAHVVGFGAKPTPIDDEIIEILQSRVLEDGYIRLDDNLKYGDEVIINSGPFKGFSGLFESHIKETDRVKILLTAIKYQSHVLIEKEMIRKVSSLEHHFIFAIFACLGLLDKLEVFGQLQMSF